MKRLENALRVYSTSFYVSIFFIHVLIEKYLVDNIIDCRNTHRWIIPFYSYQRTNCTRIQTIETCTNENLAKPPSYGKDRDNSFEVLNSILQFCTALNSLSSITAADIITPSLWCWLQFNVAGSRRNKMRLFYNWNV